MIESRQASAEFRSVFQAEAGVDQTLPFDRFMELALYHPQLGYYQKNRPRVGYGQGTDFFTAATSGPVFGELISDACTSLLGSRLTREFTFIEIGSETEHGVLDGVAHPFKAVRTLRLGETLAIAGQCVVFSNELFDAQPFRRFVARDGAWKELGVALRNHSFVEVELPTRAPDVLPSETPEGYVIDAPLAAGTLAAQIAGQPWTGLFIACDYGKSWREIAEACPAGTARSYFQHQQTNDLLARPGEQDLTCHVCWDWLATSLEDHRFTKPIIESQESFFIRRAANFIATTSTAEATRFSPRKLALLQLLHPAHLGQKFQVMHALRD